MCIDIRKISNASVIGPGNDQMDRYKITFNNKTYQLIEVSGELALIRVADNNEKKTSIRKKKNS